MFNLKWQILNMWFNCVVQYQHKHWNWFAQMSKIVTEETKYSLRKLVQSAVHMSLLPFSNSILGYSPHEKGKHNISHTRAHLNFVNCGESRACNVWWSRNRISSEYLGKTCCSDARVIAVYKCKSSPVRCASRAHGNRCEWTVVCTDKWIQNWIALTG